MTTNSSLREIREGKGMTLEKMAKRLEIPFSTYVTYENGSRKIPTDKADKIAIVLEVRREEIFLPATFAIRK